jgi:hypothetical protein
VNGIYIYLLKITLFPIWILILIKGGNSSLSLAWDAPIQEPGIRGNRLQTKGHDKSFEPKNNNQDYCNNYNQNLPIYGNQMSSAPSNMGN